MPIYKRGEIWYIDYAFQGRRHRKRIGRSKKIAELTLSEIELKIERRENLGIKDSKRTGFEAFGRDYLDYAKTNKAVKTYALNVGNLRAMGPYFNDKTLSEITPQMIEGYKAERSKKVKPATVNRDLSCLKNMFNKAIEWGHLEKNPMKGVKLLKEPPGRLRFLDSDEADRLLRELPEDVSGVVLFALNTGMRRSEILNLAWKDINFGQRMIAVEKTKTNERRMVPINDQVYELLKNLEKTKQDSEPVFAKGGINLRKHFEAAVKRISLGDFRLHDCRHSFASHLVMTGASLKVIQQLLGHKDIKMTMRYSHLSQDHLQEAVNKLVLMKKSGTNLAQTNFAPSEKTHNSLHGKCACSSVG